MSVFKTRIYDILHSGYSLLMDSRANPDGSLIDGELIRTTPVYEEGKIIGHRPTSRSKKVTSQFSIFLLFLIFRIPITWVNI